MLTQIEFSWLAAVINKLEADGQDVRDLKKLMAKERARVNALMAVDLVDYFPIGKDIMTKLDSVDYGSKNLKVEVTMLLPRESGVFDKNSAPELFESVLGNAINECLRNIKKEYVEETEKLKQKEETELITASTEHPIILTIGTMTLYVNEGQIDKTLSWQVESYKEATKEITLKSGLILKTLVISRGDYLADQINNNVVITQG
jgi:hypothetical protein|nr:MAG TPA: hypothetical protein [Caudoviricetes sp.]